jgi:hypothetical protein
VHRATALFLSLVACFFAPHRFLNGANTHPDQEQTSRTRNHTNTNTTRLLYPHPQSTHTSQHSSLLLSRTHPPRVLDPSSNAPSNKRHCYLVFVPTIGPCCCIVLWSLTLSHLAVAL